ncbi:MAG: hypothetical protein JSS66_08580 [Armatimonadetes bacterium]|nr:hypothetical protein [Armatimonadota bacterium]
MIAHRIKISLAAVALIVANGCGGSGGTSSQFNGGSFGLVAGGLKQGTKVIDFWTFAQALFVDYDRVKPQRIDMTLKLGSSRSAGRLSVVPYGDASGWGNAHLVTGGKTYTLHLTDPRGRLELCIADEGNPEVGTGFTVPPTWGPNTAALLSDHLTDIPAGDRVAFGKLLLACCMKFYFYGQEE